MYAKCKPNKKARKKKHPTKCSKWWATTTATAASKEIISNIYVLLHHSYSPILSIRTARDLVCFFFPRLNEIALTRAPDFIYSAIPFAASAVARRTNTITALAFSLSLCRGRARATNKTLFNNWAIFQIVHCGILLSDRCFWCDAMRNFQCGKVTDDCNRNGIARLGLRTSVLGVLRVWIDIGQCAPIVDYGKTARADAVIFVATRWSARRKMSMSITSNV